MVNKKVIQEWLKEAEEDYNFASANLEEHDEFFGRICFHFQQAGEKYLKAYIIKQDLLFEKIHDLIKLVKICQKKDESFLEIAEAAGFLTDLYVDTRYPAVWPVGRSKTEAEKAREAAKTIGDFVKRKLNL